MQGLIQKEIVDINGAKGPHISVVTKKIVTQIMIMITEIMILKWKQAIHYASFLFSRCYVYLCLY